MRAAHTTLFTTILLGALIGCAAQPADEATAANTPDAPLGTASAGLDQRPRNAPLWSDDAEKQRWLAIPDGTSIAVDAQGHFALPKGAVLLKTFMREDQRLETRVWMNHPDAGWRGYSYRWEASSGDAQLAARARDSVGSAMTERRPGRRAP